MFLQLTKEMPIEPISPISRGGCNALTDRFESAAPQSIPVDWQSHSLAWLDRHHPVAAKHLRSKLAQITLLRHASLAYHPVDCWTKSDSEHCLRIKTSDHDEYAKRNLISQTLHDELELKEAYRAPEFSEYSPLNSFEVSELPGGGEIVIDEDLIPAGVWAVPIERQNHCPPVKTSPRISVLTESSKSAGWMRIAMLVLVCLFVEGVLAKWLLG